jgi:hypothetical protein
MKRNVETEVEIQIFLTSTLIGGQQLPSRSGSFNPVKRAPDTQLIGGWWAPEPVSQITPVSIDRLS